jgi:hypothetical protein
MSTCCDCRSLLLAAAPLARARAPLERLTCTVTVPSVAPSWWPCSVALTAKSPCAGSGTVSSDPGTPLIRTSADAKEDAPTDTALAPAGAATWNTVSCRRRPRQRQRARQQRQRK